MAKIEELFIAYTSLKNLLRDFITTFHPDIRRQLRVDIRSKIWLIEDILDSFNDLFVCNKTIGNVDGNRGLDVAGKSRTISTMDNLDDLLT